MPMEEIRRLVTDLEVGLQESGADNVAIATVFAERAKLLHDEYVEMGDDD